jgi:hypothetical protein
VTAITLWSDQELPSTPFVWNDRDGNLVDFSSGWTFTFEVSLNGTIVLSKTSGITGSASSPNVTVDWAVNELAALGAGDYTGRLIARRTADNKDRMFPGRLTLQVRAAPTA